MRVKMSKQPPPAPTTIIQIVERPGTGSLPRDISPPTSSYMLVGCFELNGHLRQYVSLYRAVSQREGDRREK